MAHDHRDAAVSETDHTVFDDGRFTFHYLDPATGDSFIEAQLPMLLGAGY